MGNRESEPGDMAPDTARHRNGTVDQTPFLETRGISKSFGGVQALKDVDLKIHQGEVHGLVGANGAGKSTLIKILAGVQDSDAGEIMLDGRPVDIQDSQHSGDLGLSFIHQELNLVPRFSALQNMVLGLPKDTRFGLVNWRAVHRRILPVAERVGIDFPLDTPVEDLSVANRWLVSIGRAMVRETRLIAMDEPTASLSGVESERLFRVVRELSEDGISILYVSHHLDEILDICDMVTVFKDGERVATRERKTITVSSLVKDIVGGELASGDRKTEEISTDQTVLEVRNLRREPAVRGVSLTLHSGEILGLAGLVGSGRSELARLIFGADQIEDGEMLLHGEPLRPQAPYDAVRRGIGLIPEERRAEGLMLTKDVAFNINITSLRSLRIGKRLPLINRRKAKSRAEDVSSKLRIKTPSVENMVGQLSGGNQQKVVIGKWLTRDIRLLILDEPSRGVDIGARTEIHNIIRKLARDGTGVIVISSEEEEVVSLCTRVLVMSAGRIAGELVGDEITEEAILHLSYAQEESGRN